MRKRFLAFGAASMAVAVILGALGAHALQQKVSEGLMTADQLDSFGTGVRYQIYHALAILFLTLLSQKIKSKLIPYCAYLFMAGTLLFSGSIYLLATRQLLHIESWKSVLGPVTPIGGMLFIVGWFLLLIAVFKMKLNESEVREV